MNRRGRSRKKQRSDRMDAYKRMSEWKAPGSAAKQMIHRAYQSYTVDEYIRKKERDSGGGQMEVKELQEEQR